MCLEIRKLIHSKSCSGFDIPRHLPIGASASLKQIGGRGPVDPCRSGPETNCRRLRCLQVTINQKVSGQISRLLQRIINIIIGDSRRGKIGELFRQKKNRAQELNLNVSIKTAKEVIQNKKNGQTII